jgi:hypothetical protein
MAACLNVRARYSKGTLKLRSPLKLPEGAEVRVSVMPVEAKPQPRKPRKRAYLYPTRTVPWGELLRFSGIVSLGGDALADSEALYDGD